MLPASAARSIQSSEPPDIPCHTDRATLQFPEGRSSRDTNEAGPEIPAFYAPRHSEGVGGTRMMKNWAFFCKHSSRGTKQNTHENKKNRRHPPPPAPPDLQHWRLQRRKHLTAGGCTPPVVQIRPICEGRRDVGSGYELCAPPS